MNCEFKYLVCRDGLVVYKNNNLEDISEYISKVKNCVIVVNNIQETNYREMAEQLKSASNTFDRCHKSTLPPTWFDKVCTVVVFYRLLKVGPPVAVLF